MTSTTGRIQHQRKKPSLQAVLSFIIAASVLSRCSASDAHGEVAASRADRELEMKCTCYPCGYPCVYPSPPPPPPVQWPPPPPSPPPPLPHGPPPPFCPPPPPLPPWSSWPPYYSFGSPGNLYPVDAEYLPSGARRSYSKWWFPALVAVGLLLMWL